MSGIGTESNDPLPSPPEEQQATTGLDKDEEDLHQRKEEDSKGKGEMSDRVSGQNGEPKTDDQNPTVSQVYTATKMTLLPKSPHVKTHALTLEWAFGMNRALPVFSLQDQDQLVILYGGTNVAVMYDQTSNSQHVLQGHSSPISCLCVSEDRRWLVTADRGQESLVIIWDSFSGIPVRTLFDSHPEGGVAVLALSKDSKYLVTVGAGDVQRVCIWDWTNETEDPLCVTDLNQEYGFQNHIIFNPNDITQLLSNSESQVLFYTRDKQHLDYIAPELLDKTFNKVVGMLSQSVFHWRGLQALSATSAGNLVLWDMVRASSTSRPLVRRAVKLIPLQKDGITVLTLTDSFIVTGDTLGHVKFYDENFKLISWYSEFNLDPITSISFSKEVPPNSSQGYLKDCTLEAKMFVIRNFVLSTVSSTVVHVNAQGGVLQTLLREHCEALHAVACHPQQPVVAMGSHSGILKVWDYERKVSICSRVFEKERHIQCIAYDPQGFYLAVGFASGSVHVLDACTLLSEAEERFNFSQDCITHITFSPDSLYLATADAGRAVMVFCLYTGKSMQRWKYLGRHHSHYKPIRDLLFGVYLDSTQPRLLSLGMDRRLVEYDLQNSKVKDELLILSSERIEQSAVPTCMAWYPPLTTEDFLLTASDLYKMKLFNSTTKMCRKTLLGPTYGSPVEKMAMLPFSKDHDPSAHYMAYITNDKVGVQILPIDGNPHKSSALICHPTGVSAMACSYDSRYVFTAGGSDCTVLSWEISLNALEAAASLGGKELIPFYSLLDGGRDGELFREMEDFFYYCQLRNQGIDSMEMRQVSTRIPLAEVPFVMRALGFFPTEQELEDMQNEVKFSRYAESGRYVTDIDLEEFIKLYVNHRPAFGISRKELLHTFQVLGDSYVMGEPVVNKNELLELLQDRGEHMTENELAECFTTLVGLNSEGGGPELGAFECDDAEDVLESEIPEEISMETFASDILGFPIYIKEILHSSQEGMLSPSGSEVA
ncbi:cilia- and flagella-associated protein 251 isoform X1 [Salmo trutta]|uniref:cilia- and flagella-associated protein 251 isoform X1 n=2 Tax=Salmo trutta TaxID=8032 RepID=UPI001131C170|nr:cilia- and flagella-associated protein 251 isoform X1 [Salmo trutta]